MAHTVEVDADRINATFDYYANSGSESVEGEYIAGAQSEAPEGWQQECEIVAMFLAARAPNWSIPEDKQTELAQRLAAVLNRWFPGGLGLAERWGPIPQLLFCCGSIIATCGVDWQSMQLKPLQQKTEQQEDGKNEKPSAGAFKTGVDDEQ